MADIPSLDYWHADDRFRSFELRPPPTPPNVQRSSLVRRMKSSSAKAVAKASRHTAGALPLFQWLESRSAGVLLHPTCLPGDQGVGTFEAGPADRFLEFLQAAGVRYWQLCPLGPTGYGDSPYQCFSAFAGNPYLIDLHELVEHGLLDAADLAPLAKLDPGRVDFGALYRLKWPLLFRAASRHRESGAPPLYGDFTAFRLRHAAWLEDYAYFRALKDDQGGRAWSQWPAALREHAQAVTSPLRARLAEAIDAHVFTQYVFFGQWSRLKAGAARRGIGIVGDIPIFVAADSADVWANPELFELDPATSLPLAVAGVPPDYFSADGQLWGNPLYAWARHAENDYAWWHARLSASFEIYDIVRIDHIRDDPPKEDAMLRGLFLAEDMKSRTDHGAVGYPELATADKGRALLAAAIDRTAQVVEVLLKRPLPR